MTAVLTAAVLSFAGWVYQVDPALCNGCAGCIHWCTEGAISMQGPDAVIDPLLCNACGTCASVCPRGAIYLTWHSGVVEDEPGAQPLPAPVPSTGAVSLTAPAGALVEAIDMSGRIVASTVCDDGCVELDLTPAGPGAYLITVSGIAAGCAVILR